MTAEAWAAWVGLALSIVAGAVGIGWRLGRVETQLRILARHVSKDAHEHAEFRRDITTLREKLARIQPRPLGT